MVQYVTIIKYNRTVLNYTGKQCVCQDIFQTFLYFFYFLFTFFLSQPLYHTKINDFAIQ